MTFFQIVLSHLLILKDHQRSLGEKNRKERRETNTKEMEIETNDKRLLEAPKGKKNERSLKFSSHANLTLLYQTPCDHDTKIT